VRTRATSAVKQEVSLKFDVCVAKSYWPGADALSLRAKEK